MTKLKVPYKKKNKRTEKNHFIQQVVLLCGSGWEERKKKDEKN
jgi:hypothetical protein